MARVTGVGGIFFAASDPAALSAWYAQYLGVPAPPESYDDPEWHHDAGPSVFAPMPADAQHVVERGWSINLRVDNLDGMVEQLERAGVTVAVDPESYPNGRFAEAHDPEGNLVQLWEPRTG